MITFSKPTKRRVIRSLVIVVLVSCVLTGMAVCIGFIVNHEGEPVSGGEYVRLALLSLTLWGPMYLVIAWPLSVPLIAGITALVAYARVGDHEATLPDDPKITLPEDNPE
ncbi:hypothetical protein [Mycolicibacterium porcinum]|uniref:Uncharacterized protein n=1 Tax=Mycolicibacterium porcinum TaxID=39693 RepID=A0AAW5TE17_9MYCO|nr:hypothetical protein [Mycolicibacterium porcinum]MCV7392817.1 hypothetical protein [Mycolicibacterium porcinum]ORB39475.1 hypothetical protein BST41_16820 [Mycolicibacterium porcinum]CDO30246.1 hypothetical protein BN979_03051 [Mycolicibacterium vulneris]